MKTRCRVCGKPFASKLEEAALKKLTELDEAKARVLWAKRCRCSQRVLSVFTSGPLPPDLQWYDKFMR